jgi:hypothetical protein
MFGQISEFYYACGMLKKKKVKNVVRKIVNPQERSNVLLTLGRIMYSRGCPIDVDPKFWA